MLWNQYCIIRVSVVYRGRAIPLVWTVLKHPSSTVAFEKYKTLLNKAAQILLSLWAGSPGHRPLPTRQRILVRGQQSTDEHHHLRGVWFAI